MLWYHWVSMWFLNTKWCLFFPGYHALIQIGKLTHCFFRILRPFQQLPQNSTTFIKMSILEPYIIFNFNAFFVIHSWETFSISMTFMTLTFLTKLLTINLQHTFQNELWNVSLWLELCYADLAGSSRKSRCIATIRRYRTFNSCYHWWCSLFIIWWKDSLRHFYLDVFFPGSLQLQSIWWRYILQLFFKIHFYLCACVFVCMSKMPCAFKYPQSPEDWVGCAKAQAIGSCCELSNMGTRTQTSSVLL